MKINLVDLKERFSVKLSYREHLREFPVLHSSLDDELFAAHRQSASHCEVFEQGIDDEVPDSRPAFAMGD